MINLFFIPCITLWIFYRRAGLTPAWTPKLVLDYAVAAVVNVPAAHVVVWIVRQLLGSDIADFTETYTLLALVTAIVLAFAAELMGKFMKLTCEKKQQPQEEPAAQDVQP